MGNLINKNNLGKKGAYIYKDKNNKVIYFVYIKTNNKDIRNSLKLSYNKKVLNNYLIAYFDEEGNHYISQMKYNELINTIELINCEDLLKNDFRYIYNKFKINRFIYKNIMESVEKQLNVNI